jgi:hypothetical protein
MLASTPAEAPFKKPLKPDLAGAGISHSSALPFGASKRPIYGSRPASFPLSHSSNQRSTADVTGGPAFSRSSLSPVRPSLPLRRARLRLAPATGMSHMGQRRRSRRPASAVSLAPKSGPILIPKGMQPSARNRHAPQSRGPSKSGRHFWAPRHSNSSAIARFIKRFDRTAAGSRALRATSTPATGSPAGSNSPNCTRADAWSQ